MVEEKQALEIKEENEPKLFDIPGVVGVGLINPSQKITIYVKELTSEIVKEIPTEINSVPTVIVEIGEIVFMQARTDKWRPAPGGVSVGHSKCGCSGTITANVIDNVSGRRVILSNNHVLALMDSIQNPVANKGDDIWQPGGADYGSSADTIAHLERWIKWDEVNPITVDCAIAMPISDADLRDDVLEIGVPAGIIEAREGMVVKKSGRTTGLTTGTIADAHMSVTIGSVVWKDQIRVTGSEPQILPGDSGSGIFDENNNFVGLAFAGPRDAPHNYLIANKMTNVANLLNISFAPAPAPSILPLLGGAALMVSPTIIPDEMIKPSTKKLLMVGGLAITGYGLYSYFKKKKEEEEPPPPPPGTYINVNSIPSGASVLLSGVNIGNTPITNYKIEPGTYTLILVLVGYERYEETFTISKDETKTFNITLTPIEEISAKINEFTITA